MVPDPVALPVGTPAQWKRAAQSVQDAQQRQALVNFAHRLHHEPLESMLRRARAGEYANLGLTENHIRQYPPICSACAVKHLVRRPYPHVPTPNQAHPAVGNIVSLDKYDIRGLPPARGSITDLLTTIDHASSYVVLFPIRGGKKAWRSATKIPCLARLQGIYSLWNHQLKCIRSDRDPVLISRAIEEWTELNRIGNQRSAGGAHQQVGLVERFHGWLRRWMETVFYDQDHLPHELWFYVALAGCHVWNNSIHGN